MFRIWRRIKTVFVFFVCSSLLCILSLLTSYETILRTESMGYSSNENRISHNLHKTRKANKLGVHGAYYPSFILNTQWNSAWHVHCADYQSAGYCKPTSQIYYALALGDLRNENQYDGHSQALIDTPGCIIEYMNPFSEDIIPFLKNPEIIECDGDILTYVSNEGEGIYLNVNQSVVKNESLICSYQQIGRNANNNQGVPDDEIAVFSRKVQFVNRTKLESGTLIRVLCENNYQNFHYIFQKKNSFKHYNRSKPNVLMIGLDAMSRSNLLRTMPKTVKFLQNNDWIDLKGYNKILHNTCPNLMAVLTGVSPEHAGCENEEPTWMDYKDFIWNYYKDENYTTLFSEDFPVFSTFNYGKSGFWNDPTDYYLRPYYVALNSYMPTKIYCAAEQCFGPENIGPRMVEFVKDYTSTVKNKSNSFAFFWMNSFSHSDLNCPSNMDNQMEQLFQRLKNEGVFNDTFVVFFSDHGFRFGDIVETHTGWLENRLPFNFISVPKTFRLQHEKKYHNLLRNSERLTSPYDLHVTLHHILHLHNNSDSVRSASGCPTCHSLFEPMSDKRTCSDAGIPEYWCACSKYVIAKKNDSLARKASNYAVEYINALLQTTSCTTYTLSDILEVKFHETSQHKVNSIMLRVLVDPPAKFDLNIDVARIKDTITFDIQGVERLDRYAEISWCCHDTGLRKYCYCV